MNLHSFLLVVGQIDDSFFKDRTDSNCIADNGAFCFQWVIDNFADRYITPTLQHLYLVGISVVLGFAIAMAMAVLSHRRRWLVPPFIGVTGVLYTIPSVAFFFLLLPITGRGVDTALIALTAYNLQIIYRNIVAGLNNVPGGPEGRGTGDGYDRSAASVEGRVPARCARDRCGSPNSDGVNRCDRDARRIRRRRWPW